MRDFHGSDRFAGAVIAAKKFQGVVIQSLHAERNPVYASVSKTSESTCLDRCRVGLQSNLYLRPDGP